MKLKTKIPMVPCPVGCQPTSSSQENPTFNIDCPLTSGNCIQYFVDRLKNLTSFQNLCYITAFKVS